MTAATITTREVKANGLSFMVDETGEGDSVALCLHGFPESRISWRRQLPVLANLGWRAVAPDLRGFGQSSRPIGVEHYRVDRLVEDTVALFNALGAKRRLLIAHDWGGVVAWAAAAKQAIDLAGLVVMNAPHPRVYRRVFMQSWKQKAKSWYILFFQLPGLPEWVTTRNRAEALIRSFTDQVKNPSVFEPGAIETFRENILVPGAATAMINYYRANSRVIFDAALDRKIECPTLLVWGDNDAFADIVLTQGYEDFVRDFTLAIVPGVSHWVQQEAPDRVNAMLTKWMGDHGLAPASPAR
jgi:pimeloyl-ACP methyl ester carboxylesterase